MKCPLCHQPTAGACTRPHDMREVHRWMNTNVSSGGYRLAPSQPANPNVTHPDGEDGVTLVVTGYATHVVRHADLLTQMCGFGDIPPRPEPAGPTLYGRVGMPDLGLSEPRISMCPKCAVRLEDVFEDPWCPKCAWTPAMAVSRA